VSGDCAGEEEEGERMEGAARGLLLTVAYDDDVVVDLAMVMVMGVNGGGGEGGR
jgi:hypothetical protein